MDYGTIAMAVISEAVNAKDTGNTFHFLGWISHIISVARTASKKNGALIHSSKFTFPDLYKSII